MPNRFRGLLPVVIDIETSGVNPATDALLEIAMTTIKMNGNGKIYPDKTYAYHIDPFPGANFDKESLAINKIDPNCPLRFAIPEQQALHNIFLKMKESLLETGCQRTVMVAHNAWFDLAFLHAAIKRCHMHFIPMHSFTIFDTATLSGLTLGETVLARATKSIGMSFDINQAHSAIYDAERTAELFCLIVNRYS